MNIKDASKTVNAELKKLKTEVGQWHLKREEVFTHLKTSWTEQYQKTLNNLKAKPESKYIITELTSFEKSIDKTIAKSTQKLLDINNEYSIKTKSLSKDLGEIATPYLKTVKETSFGTILKAQKSIEQELSQWIEDECIEEFDLNFAVKKLNKKLFSVTKDFNKNTVTEDDHLKNMAQIEDFAKEMLIAFEPSFDLSKPIIKWIEDTPVLSSLFNEFKSSLVIDKLDNSLDKIKNQENSNVDFFIESYGNSSDPESLKRSKLAMKGVKGSFSEFRCSFEEIFIEEFGDFKGGVNCMYLNDTLDHLKLAKSCLVNDVLTMNQYDDMDTGSREMMADSLYNYLNSDEFYDQVKEQNKPKKKMKM